MIPPPRAALRQPSSARAVAPAHVAPQSQQGFARRGEALRPPPPLLCTLGLQPCAFRGRTLCRPRRLHLWPSWPQAAPRLAPLGPDPAVSGPRPPDGRARGRCVPLRSRVGLNTPPTPQGGSAREAPSRAHSRASVACKPLFGDGCCRHLLRSSVPRRRIAETADLPPSRQPPILLCAPPPAGRPSAGQPSARAEGLRLRKER